MTGKATTRLWVCHTCQRIGKQDEAETHRSEYSDHEIEQLSAETSEAVREVWLRQRAKRAAAFLGFGVSPLVPIRRTGDQASD